MSVGVDKSARPDGEISGAGFVSCVMSRASYSKDRINRRVRAILSRRHCVCVCGDGSEKSTSIEKQRIILGTTGFDYEKISRSFARLSRHCPARLAFLLLFNMMQKGRCNIQ